MSEIVNSEFLLNHLDNYSVNSDFLTEFLQLQISPQTTRVYAASIEYFFQFATGKSATPDLINQFFQLEAGRAIEVVYRYRANLQQTYAPATINNRLAAIKALVAHAQKLGRCDFDLKQVKGMKSQAYRDTTGIAPEIYREAINKIDRTTTG